MSTLFYSKPLPLSLIPSISSRAGRMLFTPYILNLWRVSNSGVELLQAFTQALQRMGKDARVTSTIFGEVYGLEIDFICAGCWAVPAAANSQPGSQIPWYAPEWPTSYTLCDSRGRVSTGFTFGKNFPRLYQPPQQPSTIQPSWVYEHGLLL